MPKVPRVPDDAAADEPVRDADVPAGAPSPAEGPAPPGVDAIPQAAEPPGSDDPASRFDGVPVDELRSKAIALAVLPTSGSGVGGRVIRDDLVAALLDAPEIPDPPAGRPPLAAVAERAAADLALIAAREE
jgi:pyruvate dehydrogenase E2 component (dihydrolipoamide acetyltransferase)